MGILSEPEFYEEITLWFIIFHFNQLLYETSLWLLLI